MRSFNEIKEQIEKYPEILTANEGAIEIAFKENRLTEKERKELLILLLETEYKKLKISADYPYNEQWIEVPANVSELEKKVIKIFKDFDLTKCYGRFGPALFQIFAQWMRLKKKYHTDIKLDHVIAIFSYVRGLFLGDYLSYHLNSELRGANPSAYALRIAKLLNEALDFLPNYKGVVQRSIIFELTEFGTWEKMIEHFIKKYKTGSKFMEKGFLSASRRDHTFGGNVIFIINSITGKDLLDFTSYHESEVLYKTRTRFRVSDFITDQTKQHIIIHLEEF